MTSLLAACGEVAAILEIDIGRAVGRCGRARRNRLVVPRRTKAEACARRCPIGWGGSVNATVSIATLTTPLVKAHTVADL